MVGIVLRMDRTRIALMDVEQAAEIAVRSAVYEFVTMRGADDERAHRIAELVMVAIERMLTQED